MDIYSVIKEDHEIARKLMSRLHDTGPGEAEERGRLFGHLKDELTMHQLSEEATFYAALKAEDETKFDALEAINEHHVVNGLLDELEMMPVDNDDWTAKLSVLGELVEHHMDEEENEIFDHARTVLTSDRSRELGSIMRQKKQEALAAIADVA